MRLIKDEGYGSFRLVEQSDDNTPPYAILSHTWGADGEEVTFKDLVEGTGKSKAGYKKIEFCGKQAASDGLQFFWVDTCCIDKSSSAELTEAINSMFRWYQNGTRCYVYLADVLARNDDKSNNQSELPWELAFRRSRWFTRGWTLQELIAPDSVEFFSREKVRLGDKNTLQQQIHEITRIPIEALRGASLSHFSFDERMRWVENRDTTRKEDKAYCLLGILDVFLPVIYGEREHAFTRLKEQISMRSRILDKLPFIKEATFNPYDHDHSTCHPATRLNLLKEVQDWARSHHGKSIFWLQGMAGTGKSTISWTIAKWLTDQGPQAAANLGASFFFKRGEGDRGSAALLFPTIARQLVTKIGGLDVLMAKAVESDQDVYNKSLGEQFNRLILEPLQQLGPTLRSSIYVVVVDALDECEKEGDIRTVLQLWSSLPKLTNTRLRLFLTSRPELPIRLEFKKTLVDIHQGIVLHSVPTPIIQHDILTFLTDAFAKVREEYNLEPPGTPLANDWPGHQILQDLTNIAVPLFIVAATMYRYIHGWEPKKGLETILQSRQLGHLSHIGKIYLPVLRQIAVSMSDKQGKEELYGEFRTVVGAVVTLAAPLSRVALATLLNVQPETVAVRLQPLHSVLQIPFDEEAPIRPLHLSFPEFLTSQELCNEPFGVDGLATHRMLFRRCLELLSGPDVLRENLCDLKYPGQPRQEIDTAMISERLPPAFQYACRYWVHHVQHSMVRIHDDDEVHVFLRKHFLHWLEALSLMNRVAESITYISVLQSLVLDNNSTQLSCFLEDARRIVLANRYIVNLAPLQLYSSAMVFAPQNSSVGKICGRLPTWIRRSPIPPVRWGAELQKLEGHTYPVTTVAFSQDGSLLASGSLDKTVRLWNPATGQEVQKLEGHTGSVTAVAFSQDGSLLVSVSNDKTVRLWNPATGQEVQKLGGHTDRVTAVAFSQDGSLLASGSPDKTVRLWNPATGQEVQKLEGHIGSVTAVAFSQDGSLLASASDDKTVRVWNPATSQEVQKLGGHTNRVTAVAFSQDGSLLASASHDKTVRLWNPATGQEVQILEGHTDRVTAVAFSQDGSLLASASYDKTVRLWNPATGQEVQKLEGHTQTVTTVAFSQDGSLLASASYDKTVRLWNPATSQEVQIREGHTDRVTTVAFSQDGSLLASASPEKTVRLWNPATGQEVQKLEGHNQTVTAVAFSQDGSLLASASHDKTVRLWNPATGQEVQKLEGHTNWITAVAFSQDGSLLASASYDKTIRVWNPPTGQEVQKLEGHTNWVTAVAFSRDGSLLASASYDKTVRLWNPATGQKVQKLEGHTNWVTAVAFSQEGSLLASASDDEMVRLWNPATGQEVQKLGGHTNRVTVVALSEDGSLLASASHDKTVRVWNLATGQEVWRLDKVPNITTISLTAHSLLTNRGTIRINNESISRRPASEFVIRNTSFVKDEWIQKNGFNFLWLPQEYRGLCSAFNDNIFAIGQHSGQVSFIQLDHTRMT